MVYKYLDLVTSIIYWVFGTAQIAIVTRQAGKPPGVELQLPGMATQPPERRDLARAVRLELEDGGRERNTLETDVFHLLGYRRTLVSIFPLRDACAALPPQIFPHFH